MKKFFFLVLSFISVLESAQCQHINHRTKKSNTSFDSSNPFQFSDVSSPFQFSDSLLHYINSAAQLNRSVLNEAFVQEKLKAQNIDPINTYKMENSPWKMEFKDSKMVDAFLYAQLHRLDEAFSIINKSENYEDKILTHYSLLPAILFSDKRINQLLDVNYGKFVSESKLLSNKSKADKQFAIELLLYNVLDLNINWVKANRGPEQKKLAKAFRAFVAKKKLEFYEKNGMPTLDKFSVYVCTKMSSFFENQYASVVYDNIEYFEELAIEEGLLTRQFKHFVIRKSDGLNAINGMPQKYGTLKGSVSYFEGKYAFQSENSEHQVFDFKPRYGIDTSQMKLDLTFNELIQEIDIHYQKFIDHDEIAGDIYALRSAIEKVKDKSQAKYYDNSLIKLGLRYSHLNKVDSAHYYLSQADISQFKDKYRVSNLFYKAYFPGISLMLDKRSEPLVDSLLMIYHHWETHCDDKEKNYNLSLYKEFKKISIIDVMIDDCLRNANYHNNQEAIEFFNWARQVSNAHKVNRSIEIIENMSFPDPEIHTSFVSNMVVHSLANFYPYYVIDRMDYFENLMLEGSIPNTHMMASFVDAVKVIRGKKQKYGTQELPVVVRMYKFIAYLIEDPENVDELRKSINIYPVQKVLSRTVCGVYIEKKCNCK